MHSSKATHTHKIIHTHRTRARANTRTYTYTHTRTHTHTHTHTHTAQVPVVRHFLDDVAKNGRYTGFPILGVEWQKLENTDLRSACNMAVGCCCGGEGQCCSVGAMALREE